MNTHPFANWKDLLIDIRVWIGVFFFIRLFGITNPPLDPATTIRQVDVLTITRNFYEIDANILYPRIDINGRSEIVGVEFPIYNYLIYLVAWVFGYDHWYGRIINLVVTSIALLCFHHIVRRWFGREAAFNATIVFLFSSWFAYARVTLPDIFAGSFCIISLYFAFRYFDTGHTSALALFCIIGSLGCLSKITSASLLTVLLLPMLSREIFRRRKIFIAGASLTILLAVSAWYFYWVPHLQAIGTGYFFMGIPLGQGLKEIAEAPLVFADIIMTDPLKYVGFVAVIASVIYMVAAKKILPLLAFLVPFVAYCLLILKLGKAFYINGYYFLLFVPSMALIAGLGLSLIPNKVILYVFISAIALENVINQIHIFESGPPYNTFTQLEPIFDSVGSDRNDLIAIGNTEGYPMAAYMAHRKAWNLPNEHFRNQDNVTELKQKGCKYILILRKIYPDNLRLDYPVVFDSENFTIYKL